jgi:hypothetical protein
LHWDAPIIVTGAIVTQAASVPVPSESVNPNAHRTRRIRPGYPKDFGTKFRMRAMPGRSLAQANQRRQFLPGISLKTREDAPE